MVQASVFRPSVNSGFSETIASIQAKFCCGILATMHHTSKSFLFFSNCFLVFKSLWFFFVFCQHGTLSELWELCCMPKYMLYYCSFTWTRSWNYLVLILGRLSFSSVKVQILKMFFKLIDQFPQLTWIGRNFKTNFLINWRDSGGFRKVIIIKTLSD